MKNSRRTIYFLLGLVIILVLFLWASWAYACSSPDQWQQQQQKQSITINETRTYHPAADIRFAPLGSYNGEYIRGANFIPIEVLTKFKKVFSYEAAYKDYGKQYGKGKCITIGHSYNGREEIEPSKEIRVLTEVNPNTVVSIGFLTIKAVEKNVDSFIVMQKAILSAALMKADAILVTGEGAETTVKSSGWGIGFNTSGGTIDDIDNRGRSAAASGGTGWSTGKASLLTFPWLQIQVLKYK